MTHHRKSDHRHEFAIISVSLDSPGIGILIAQLVARGDAAVLADYSIPCFEGKMVSDDVAFAESKDALVTGLDKAVHLVKEIKLWEINL